jgi:ATP-dependent DNA helicase RecQ
MRNEQSARLVRPFAKAERRSRKRPELAANTDIELFEALKNLRRRFADERGAPVFTIFTDATLRALSLEKPTSLGRMRQVWGVGEQKLNQFGREFAALIAEHCAARGLTTDVAGPSPQPQPPSSPKPNTTTLLAFDLFRQGIALADVVHQTNRAPSTVAEYLVRFIKQEKPASIASWVSDAVYQRVARAVKEVGSDRLTPIYLALNEQVSYDDIRIVVTHLGAVPSGQS